MKLTSRHLALLGTLAFGVPTLLLSSGCIVVAAGAGAGTVAYVRGDLETTLNHNVDELMRASNRAIEALKFSKVSEKSDLLNGQLIARTSEDKRIQITLKKESDKVTKLSIRVSAFGDSRIQQALLDKIKENL